jgi:excinuclease ABC subunit B
MASKPFVLHAPYKPTGDQPQAIEQLVHGLSHGEKHLVLLGATGTGKTFAIANVVTQLQRPALVIAHNKTLAAQLYSEFRDFFPDNAVEYFVSYYDYYQPEAYVPRHDLYIEKETEINEEIERLRLAATTALLSRRDVLIVASVSCIYGLGSPEAYGKVVIVVEKGQAVRRQALLRQLVESHYERNDLDLKRGAFRVRGDTVEVMPAYGDTAVRLSFFGDEVERLTELHPVTGEILADLERVEIYPARHFITEDEKLRAAVVDIEAEAAERVAWFRAHDKPLEAERLEQRTRYDLEMMREVGYCAGIENYSRHLDRRAAGSPPWVLLDYFPPDYLLVLDESHMTVPQVRGMWGGDRSRKQVLVDFGFRLPSALDNRPLSFEEFEEHMGQTVYTSATPGPYELERAERVVDQIIRPTGIVDPQVEVRPVQGQVDNLLTEIRVRVARGERTLVTTLTKRMAEDLADYLHEAGIKVHYLHSEVQTLERVEILRDLRLGTYDVVVGINLLREGLDLPEVSLVAILDADKEGFLRSDTALIQTIGRAARHVQGLVIMYADHRTESMERALRETDRRRAKQIEYNREHDIEPVSIVKAVHDLTERVRSEGEPEAAPGVTRGELPRAEMERLVHELEKEMRTAAQALEFEKAAMLRDQVYELRGALEEERVTRASPGSRLSPEGAESGPPERGRPRRRARASTR